jgi:glycosyltransferase involved in cell wall biosynthesis
MKKVLLLFLGRTGGGPVYAYEMACALSKFSKIFVILSSYIDNRKSWEKEMLINKNIEIKYVKTYRSKLWFPVSILNIFHFIKIITMINKYDPDVLYSTHVHYWDPFIYPFIKCGNKIKTIHDPKIKKGEDGLAWRLLYYFSFRYADKYIILSDKFKPILMEKGIHENNIIVIPHAGFSYYNKETNDHIFQFHNAVLFFGRIVEYKGLDVLLAAMKIVINDNPDIKLVIAGNGDISEYRKDICLLKPNITLYNYWVPNDQVKRYFTHIDVCVLPYTGATQSGIIPLSYSFSKPVIASDVGALSEQVKHGDTGFLIKPCDPVILAGIILKLMSCPGLINEMGKKCYDHYKSNLTWASSAREVLSLIGIEK